MYNVVRKWNNNEIVEPEAQCSTQSSFLEKKIAEIYTYKCTKANCFKVFFHNLHKKNC